MNQRTETENESDTLSSLLALLLWVLVLMATLGYIVYECAAQPEFAEITGYARCEAVKETIDERGMFWSDRDAARDRLEEYRIQIGTVCPNEFAALRTELESTLQEDCKTARWGETAETAKAFAECGVTVKDDFTIVGNVVQMREGTFFLPTISSVYVDSHSYHGVTGYALRVVLRSTEKRQYFTNRYSNKKDADADLHALVSSMASVTPAELGRVCKAN